MTTTKPVADPAAAPPLSNEADIGSGEKTPGQLETEHLIRQIPPLPPGGKADPDAPGDKAGPASRPPASAGG